MKTNLAEFPISLACRSLKISRASYYAWASRPSKEMDAKTLNLHCRCKALFAVSKGSLGSRQLMKKLDKEGFKVGRYKVRKLMKALNLRVIQRQKYRVIKRKVNRDLVADNVLNQQFNQKSANVVWAGDITYLRTNQGWVYLAIVMDLYSRRIVGWHIGEQINVELVKRALRMAIHLRRPKAGLILHTDQGSQYTSHSFQDLLAQEKIISSMSGKGACWDNAVVERFFGSLKNEWLLGENHPCREEMVCDVEDYIKYYNQDRLHTANNDCSPIEFEMSQVYVSSFC